MLARAAQQNQSVTELEKFEDRFLTVAAQQRPVLQQSKLLSRAREQAVFRDFCHGLALQVLWRRLDESATTR